MDTGRLKNNNSFYAGYEDEGEVTLSLKDLPEYCIHIWEGYFEDIFGKPLPYNGGWSGFTRDYQECKGAFGSEAFEYIQNISEYLSDLGQYEGRSFQYEETGDCHRLLIAFLRLAKEKKSSIVVTLS